MSEMILTSIEEMFDSSPALDRQSTFDQLWAITGELFERVERRFKLQRDPSCDDLRPYQGFEGAGGYLANYAGPEIDWLTHSWTGNPICGARAGARGGRASAMEPVGVGR